MIEVSSLPTKPVSWK